MRKCPWLLKLTRANTRITPRTGTRAELAHDSRKLSGHDHKHDLVAAAVQARFGEIDNAATPETNSLLMLVPASPTAMTNLARATMLWRYAKAFMVWLCCGK